VRPMTDAERTARTLQIEEAKNATILSSHKI